MIRPYPHEKEALDALTRARRESRVRALLVMASSLGKTITAALDVKRWLRQHPGQRILFLCHQNEILEQAQKEFARVLGWKKKDRYAFFTGVNRRGAHEATIVFASFQTMREWRTTFKKRKFGYIVVDESHHSQADTYRPTLEYFKPKFLLGITATPDRMDLKDIRKIYGPEVFNLPLEDALARGLVTKVDYRLVTDELDNVGLLDTPIGKLSVKHLNKTLFMPKRDEEIAKLLNKHARGIKKPRVMIFCRTTQHCDRLATKIPGALAIHYRLPGIEQRLRLEMFRKGGVHTVLTVNKFNEGIDIPEANIVAFLRLTESETIFLQQLGRGLRKSRGKNKVLVLDFVANCERLQMVHRLWSKVREIVARRGQREHKPSVEVDIGRVKFTEVAKRVLDVLGAIKGGYTRTMLIGQLQRLAKELGRTPSCNDINRASRQGKCASADTFKHYFGSIVASQTEALLSARKTPKSYSPSELIAQLKQLATELGRTPTSHGIEEAAKLGKCAPLSAFQGHFGSVIAAKKAAKLPIEDFKWTREELIGQLQQLAKEIERTPTNRDIDRAAKQGRCASYQTFHKRLGSMSAIRKAAKLYVSPRRTRTVLIAQLKQLAKELGRTPSMRDITAASKLGKCASTSSFQRLCGSIMAAQRMARLKPVPLQQWTHAELLCQLQQLAKELGRTPTQEDINKAAKLGKCASADTMRDRLGSSIVIARQMAGLSPIKRPTRHTSTSILNQMQQLAKELGRTPSTVDIQQASQLGKIACWATITRTFGSLAALRKTARLPRPMPKTRYTAEKLIGQLKQLAKELGRTPTQEDINKASKLGKCACMTTIARYCKSLPNAQKLAGLAARKSPTLYTRGDLIRQLQRLAVELGRTPTNKDINQASKEGKIASHTTFQERFGSTVAAQKLARLPLNRGGPKKKLLIKA